MKFVSWNVNGLRACMGKGFMDSFKELDADFFCLQETKLQAGQITMDLPGYHQYWCYAQKKGYSGTAIFTRHEPRSVRYGLGIEELDTEGRVITLEYDEFYLVTCYTPNAQRGLARIEHRLKWEEAFRQYMKGLDSQKPVILCGDLNVAHQEIDLKNPSSNRGNAGFSDEERGAFTALLAEGFTDTFRHLYPDVTGAYSWWSYMFNARQNNAGWRIDYFVVSDRLAVDIHDATIHPDIMGSDHCPVGLDLNTLCNGGIPFPQPDFKKRQDDVKADGTPSVGLGRILLTLGTILAVLALLIIPNLLPSPEPEPAPVPDMVDIPPMQSPPLISDVIDRTGSVTYSIESAGPLSSTMAGEFLTCGEERFRLQPVVYLDTVIMQSPSPNFYIQIQFSHTEYTNVDKPAVSTSATSYSGNDRHYRKVRYYYGEGGGIAGCFVYGYLTHTATVTVTVTIGENSCTREIDITPTFDFASMTTKELVDFIHSAGDVQASRYISYSGYIDDLIRTDASLQELLSRDDVIPTLLELYSKKENYSTVGILLYHPDFMALMTAEDLQALKSLAPEPPGDLIAGWADEPAAISPLQPDRHESP